MPGLPGVVISISLLLLLQNPLAASPGGLDRRGAITAGRTAPGMDSAPRNITAATRCDGIAERRVQREWRSRVTPSICFLSVVVLMLFRLRVQHTSSALPPLKILSPRNGATVSSPLAVVFETPADLSNMTMGAHMVEETAPHLHIDLDKRVNMPAMKQLTRVGANRYRFSLGTVSPGRHAIRVYWADAKAHKLMGSAHVVAITVK